MTTLRSRRVFGFVGVMLPLVAAIGAACLLPMRDFIFGVAGHATPLATRWFFDSVAWWSLVPLALLLLLWLRPWGEATTRRVFGAGLGFALGLTGFAVLGFYLPIFARAAG
jgi:hypothetical protein